MAKTYTISEIAKEVGATGSKLNSILESKNIQYDRGGVKQIYKKHQQYKGKIIAKTVSTEVKGIMYHQLRWTEQGRKFIHDLHRSGKLHLDDGENFTLF